jgi:hypothetical protein
MLTRSEAIAARDEIDARKHRRRKSGVYRCEHCGTWHLTSAHVDSTAKLRAHRPPSPEMLDLDDLPLRVPQRVLRRG